MVFQDFLAGTSKETQRSRNHHHHSSTSPEIQHELPLPPTALSLNSVCHHRQQQLSSDHDSAHHHHHYHHRRINNHVDGGGVHNDQVHDIPPVFFDAINIGSPPPAVGLFSFCPIKRDLDTSCGDRRHKRLMKNRESASRSRARKQAYTNELELEVAQLEAENGKLKKQYEELTMAMEAQHSTKKGLQRTLTAPF